MAGLYTSFALTYIRLTFRNNDFDSRICARSNIISYGKQIAEYENIRALSTLVGDIECRTKHSQQRGRDKCLTQ